MDDRRRNGHESGRLKKAPLFTVYVNAIKFGNRKRREAEGTGGGRMDATGMINYLTQQSRRSIGISPGTVEGEITSAESPPAAGKGERGKMTHR